VLQSVFGPPSTVSEYAAFADVTVHFTSQFDVQFGGRESWDHVVAATRYSTGLFVPPPPPVVTPAADMDSSAFTYLVTPEYKLSPDLMLYARFASGYRLGGFNVGVPGIPRTYNPDKTNDYDLGIKGVLLDGHLSYDASLYYIDWRHIQIYVLDPALVSAYLANAGAAKSQGVEFSIQARPFAGLTVKLEGSYDDAVLTQNFPTNPNAVGSLGDRLPFSSRFSGSVSAEEEFPLTGALRGFAGGVVTYVDSRKGEFPGPTQTRVEFPAYVKADLRAGTRYENWTANLFLNNVADRRGIVGGGSAYFGTGYVADYIQPRTVGLSITRAF